MKIKGLFSLIFCCALEIVFIVVDACYVDYVLFCCEGYRFQV